MRISVIAVSRRLSTQAAATLALACAANAQAFVGTFDPEPREYTGPQLVTFIDSNAAPVRCIQLAVAILEALAAAAGTGIVAAHRRWRAQAGRSSATRRASSFSSAFVAPAP